MRENKYFLNTALAAVWGLAMLAAIFIRSFAPAVIIPMPDIPFLVLVSLLALVIDHYAAKGAVRCYICIPILSAVTFGLLPFAGGFVGIWDALKLALAGGVTFTLTTLLYSSIQERLSTGPAAKAAPVMSAVGLYLAVQCFSGWIL